MQNADPESMPHQSRWRANWLTAILALIVFLLRFCGRLLGLWLFAWDILPVKFDPVCPLECILAGPLTLIALSTAVIRRRRSGQSRLLSLAIVLSIVTLLWASLSCCTSMAAASDVTIASMTSPGPLSND